VSRNPPGFAALNPGYDARAALGGFDGWRQSLPLRRCGQSGFTHSA
jgi:hypothetical protein